MANSFMKYFSLTAIFLVAAFNASAQETVPSADETSQDATEEVVTLAGGCFWCTEAVFERMEGVNDVVSGYIGGRNANPTYQQVCTGTTNHAEAVEVYYDPEKTSLEEILHLFFKTHDPTTLNKQGLDEGTQYRSSVFFRDEEQKKIAEDYIDKLNKSREFRGKIVTQLENATTFYPAEEYHQDYYRKNPYEGYCRAVVARKVTKAKQVLGDKLKKVENDK